MFSGFREVKDVSANQRPGGHHVFSDWPEQDNFGRGIKILLPVKFRFIPFSGFTEVENV